MRFELQASSLTILSRASSPSVMSNSSAISTAVLLGTTADVPSLRHTLSPGIVGLFVQGLETGLVLAQLSSWLSAPEHTESLFIISLTVFVTILGL